ncbi:MAG: WS/DGAT/MGAT family O-acyltransferase [Alphaproteobacteria bacterium]
MLTQLSGMDAMFLYQELDNAPMHIAGLAIYDPATAPGGFVRFKDILNTFEERLHLSPIFRRRLVQVPLNLDHPYWIEDPNFDLEFHVRHIALPKPGDWRQLCIQTSRLFARPMDLNRPLWEATVIEGLDNMEGVPEGSYAIFTKMHHAAIDGASGAEITAAIHDLTPEPRKLEPEETWVPDKEPTPAELLSRAYMNNLRTPFKMARVLSDAIPAISRVRAGVKSSELKSLGKKPKTRFNGPISAHRVFDGVNLSLEEVKAVKNAVEGATVNDVMLTTVGGALRKYLEHRHELPNGSLVAGAPINVRTEEEKGTGGNMINQMNVPLRTDIADPKERLQAVHEEAVASKAYANAVGARIMTDVTQSVPPAIAALGSRAAVEAGLTHRFNPPFNCIVTNVPGPQIPLYMGGAKLVRNYGFAPLTEGMGLTHPILSYDGMISIGFQACREMLPDPEFYAQCIQESFDDLKRATGVQTPSKAA